MQTYKMQVPSHGIPAGSWNLLEKQGDLEEVQQDVLSTDVPSLYSLSQVAPAIAVTLSSWRKLCRVPYSPSVQQWNSMMGSVTGIRGTAPQQWQTRSGDNLSDLSSWGARQTSMQQAPPSPERDKQDLPQQKSGALWILLLGAAVGSIVDSN